METIRKYGKQPYRIGLLHGGPGASGEMKPVAERLSQDFGILEFFQTKKSVNGQIEELHAQLSASADFPAILIGYSWGAWLGFLFTSRYPDLITKLILVGAVAFDNKYNVDLMKIRLDRLSQQNKAETEKLQSKINSGDSDNNTLKRFGELMSIADAYDYSPIDNDAVTLDMTIFQSVWAEASKLRDTKQLINCVDKIKCPVVAIHGDYDSHPIDGVEKPLSDKLADFKMIRIEKCGHTPWKERFAKDVFFEILRNELYLYYVMTKEELEITEIVNRETKAWDTQDVDLLISIFHPDMVWPWPKTPTSHDPMDWELVLGKFDKARWSNGWQDLFDNYKLAHNHREIKKIVISKEKDGAFAVVDIDTLWIDRNNNKNHWMGRVCKVYSKIADDWKMTMHIGVLEY